MTNGEPRTALQPDGGGGGAHCITFVDWWAVKKNPVQPGTNETTPSNARVEQRKPSKTR